MIKERKSEEQAVNERAELLRLKTEIRGWIDSGIPRDFQSWDFMKAGRYRTAMENANKVLAQAAPNHKKLYDTRSSLVDFYKGY